MEQLVKVCGLSLLAGGVLLILVNVLLTPGMLAIEDEAAMRSADVYLVRLSLAWLTALLLLPGTAGVHLAQADSAGHFGKAAFVAAFIGTTLLLSLEWSNIFVLRPLAQSAPEALAPLDESALMNIGAASAAGVFSLGWLLLAISVVTARVLSRAAGATVIAGLVLIPLLAASPLGLYGMIAGNVVLGLGFVLLGRSVVLTRSRERRP